MLRRRVGWRRCGHETPPSPPPIIGSEDGCPCGKGMRGTTAGWISIERVGGIEVEGGREEGSWGEPPSIVLSKGAVGVERVSVERNGGKGGGTAAGWRRRRPPGNRITSHSDAGRQTTVLHWTADASSAREGQSEESHWSARASSALHSQPAMAYHWTHWTVDAVSVRRGKSAAVRAQGGPGKHNTQSRDIYNRRGGRWSAK